jgi:hypothetical protein
LEGKKMELDILLNLADKLVKHGEDVIADPDCQDKAQCLLAILQGFQQGLRDLAQITQGKQS